MHCKIYSNDNLDEIEDYTESLKDTIEKFKTIHDPDKGDIDGIPIQL